MERTTYMSKLISLLSMFNNDEIKFDEFVTSSLDVINKMRNILGFAELRIFDEDITRFEYMEDLIKFLKEDGNDRPYSSLLYVDISKYLEETVNINHNKNVNVLSCWVGPNGETYFVKSGMHVDIAESLFIDENTWLKYSPEYGFVSIKNIPNFKITPAQKMVIKKYYGIEV